MEQELTDAFGEIRGAIGDEAATTRGEIRRVHQRIDTEKDIRQKEMAEHDKVSAVRSVQLQNGIDNTKAETERVDKKQDDHQKWHKDQKTSSRGMWIAIGIAILSGLLGLLEKCASNF